MKTLISVLTIAVFTAGCSTVNTSATKPDTAVQTKKESSIANKLPTDEKAFVAAIKEFDKKAIVENLGEPAKAEDVRVKGTDKIVASIWEYHYINTGENGEYFPITELDFIDDKVVQVVFINQAEKNDTEKDGQVYEFPENRPEN
ncbi:MAG: hypothetical protein ACSHWN_08540 [Methylophilaceae bacterium]